MAVNACVNAYSDVRMDGLSMVCQWLDGQWLKVAKIHGGRGSFAACDHLTIC